MEDIRISPKIKVKDSPLQGKGVFAIEPIQSGEIIEVSYCIVIPKEEYKNYIGTLSRYWFSLGNDWGVGLGYASIYNHSQSPNIRADREGKYDIKFTAIKDIKVGEELCHKYCTEEGFRKNYLI